MTTTTTTKQTSSAALPPHDLQDGSKSNDSNPQAEVTVEKDKNATDILKTVKRGIDNPVVSPDHDPASNLDPNSDRETQMTEKKDDEEKKEDERKEDETNDGEDYEDEKLEAPKSTGEILLAHVLEQNRYLIEQLAGQNKQMVDHLASAASPPMVLCGAQGDSGSSSAGKTKKNGGTSNAIVVTRICRIASVIMLVVIAMLLGSMRGDDDRFGAVGKSGRKFGGFFGR